MRMENFMIGFISILIAEIILFIKIWMDGTYVGLRFAKWYFGIAVMVAVIVGIWASTTEW
ncbi:hypothetical protein [Paenibacillus sp. y28]|uniref:hypothetical protein n=1 Tax=Paenibacillus sp. y28 TaxID=3129110 RepID=UPI003019A94A